MILLDTDVMVDFLRGYSPAIEWVESLEEAPGLPGFVLMELMDGCTDKHAMSKLVGQVEPFQLHWPGDSDCNRALATFSQVHLSHGTGILDAVIGECAIGLDATLCTFNKKHFKALNKLRTEQPYKKNSAKLEG